MTRDEFEKTVYADEHESVEMSREELHQYLVYQQALRDIISRDEQGMIDVAQSQCTMCRYAGVWRAVFYHVSYTDFSGSCVWHY